MQLSLTGIAKIADASTLATASAPVPKAATDDSTAAPINSAVATDRITMSHGSRQLSKTADKDSDAVTQAIQDSKFPDEVKKLMIKIRELQTQLRDKAAELQKVVGDKTLSSRQREMKTAAIRDAVSTITSAIRAATATLNDTLTVMRASSDDRRAIATLLSGA
ncbi:hypothetical protein SB751_20020 [Cupriavidus sp. SIMBA_020]|uniref:hypothetical protein n=1 Tax=Cupriavidus sp. SIMBA_020 TaxID=3085766 RepID=UPI00397AB57F